ncbi:MAG: ABC transporter ATP-binding protein [Lachnospiraceae bacterium]|nr:ABC transporter ATP-binding protein [Lachnospiraceae bacterium]
MEVEDIKKSYGKKTVLDGVSLSAEGGSCTGLLGANGCGKSTLLSILAGIMKPDGGSFDIKGAEDGKKPVIGYVPQGTPLIEELSAMDNLRLWYDKEALDESLSGGVLKTLGVDTFLKVPVKKMSGGMKKCLSIGCAVASDPDVLLLDEPTAALDLARKDTIYAYMSRFKSKGGIVLIATHDIHEIEFCDRCYLFEDHRLSDYDYNGDVHALAGLMR